MRQIIIHNWERDLSIFCQHEADCVALQRWVWLEVHPVKQGSRHAHALPEALNIPTSFPPFSINSSIILFNQHCPLSNVLLISYRVHPFPHRMSYPAEVLIENPIKCSIDPLSTFTSPSLSKFPKLQPNKGTSCIFSSQTASDQGGLGQAYPCCWEFKGTQKLGRC